MGEGDSIKKILMSEDDWVEGELPCWPLWGIDDARERSWRSAEAQAAVWPLLQALLVQKVLVSAQQISPLRGRPDQSRDPALDDIELSFSGVVLQQSA